MYTFLVAVIYCWLLHFQSQVKSQHSQNHKLCTYMTIRANTITLQV